MNAYKVMKDYLLSQFIACCVSAAFAVFFLIVFVPLYFIMDMSGYALSSQIAYIIIALLIFFGVISSVRNAIISYLTYKKGVLNEPGNNFIECTGVINLIYGGNGDTDCYQLTEANGQKHMLHPSHSIKAFSKVMDFHKLVSSGNARNVTVIYFRKTGRIITYAYDQV